MIVAISSNGVMRIAYMTDKGMVCEVFDNTFHEAWTPSGSMTNLKTYKDVREYFSKHNDDIIHDDGEL